MVRKSTISKVINFLNQVKDSGYSSVYQYCKANNISYSNWSTRIKNVITANVTSDNEKDIKKVKILKNNLSNKTATSEEIDNLNDIDKNEILRDTDGKIIGYRYNIKRKSGKNLIGTFSRDDMERLCNLYSSYGQNLTGKQVSIEFPGLAYADFQRIRNSFLIYKYGCPFAPHTIEESTEEELRNLATELKAQGLVRKLEKDQLKETVKASKLVFEENKKLKNNLDIITSSTKFDISGLPIIKPLDNLTYRDTTLVLHLSDLHIGAKLNSDSLFNNDWNEKELVRRLTSVINFVKNLQPSKVVINMLGDMLDGMDNQTARRDHFMPQNMDNKEQFNVFIKTLSWFIMTIKKLTNELFIYSVPSGNHDGDFGYISTKCLQATLQDKVDKFIVFDKFIGSYTLNNHTYVIMHGKDPKFMKKPLPLKLDDKSNVWLRNYLDRENINGNNIHIIKGDLHSSAYEETYKFDYRNCLSLFGDSDYSQMNYPSNGYGVSYDLFINNNLTRGELINM